MEYELEFYENPNDNTDYYFRAVADGIVIDKFDVDDVCSIVKEYMDNQKRTLGYKSPKRLHEAIFNCDKENPCEFEGCPFGKEIED
jgi:hypothetical protein